MFIYDLFESASYATLVIYPGRFQPWHKGHKAVYDFLVKKFGLANVFVASSNKVEPPRSPFNFSDKTQFMNLTGVTSDHIVETRDPYKALEIVEKYEPTTTRLIFAVSEKDMATDPRFKFGSKKDGSPTYFQPMPTDTNTMVSLSQHGYIMTVPTFNFTVLGEPMQSATQVREQFVNADEETQKRIVVDLFGRFDPHILSLMQHKLGQQSLAEGYRTNRMPNPQDFDSDWDYQDALDAYQNQSDDDWYDEPEPPEYDEFSEDWQKVNKHDKTDGMSSKAVKTYRRENPGSKLKTAVTTKPSKLKAGSKAANRRKSFCARMSGNKGPMKKPNGKPTPKALALRRWNCESIEEMQELIMLGEAYIANLKQGVTQGQLNEFSQGSGGDSGNYFQTLASAWYNGTFDSGSLQKGIKSQEDIERLLNRGIVCPDGKTRKMHIDYNSDFNGVEIYSDDYYEYGDDDDTIDSRTGQKWGPYDFMVFSDEDLSEGVAEGAPIVVMPNPERLKKAEPTKVRYQGDIVPPTKTPSTEKRGVKGRPGQRPMPGRGVAEGFLNEFAVDSSGGREDDEYDLLFKLVKMWWIGNEQQHFKAEKTLASMGISIEENEPDIILHRGKQFLKFPMDDFEQGVAEGGYPEVDHMPGPTIKRTQTGCKRCHGKGYVYKTPDGEVHPTNQIGAKKYKCGKCDGIGFVKVAEQGVAEATGPAQQAAIAIAKKKDIEEEKVRLDPKCWTGKHKEGTKIKVTLE